MKATLWSLHCKERLGLSLPSFLASDPVYSSSCWNLGSLLQALPGEGAEQLRIWGVWNFLGLSAGVRWLRFLCLSDFFFFKRWWLTRSQVSEYERPANLWKKLREVEVDLTSLSCTGRVGQSGVEVCHPRVGDASLRSYGWWCASPGMLEQRFVVLSWKKKKNSELVYATSLKQPCLVELCLFFWLEIPFQK